MTHDIASVYTLIYIYFYFYLINVIKWSELHSVKVKLFFSFRVKGKVLWATIGIGDHLYMEECPRVQLKLVRPHSNHE